MSWEGFKKNLNRASTSLLQKTGVVEKTIDTEFSLQESKLKSFAGQVESLHKEAKVYLDSMRAITICQERLTQCFNELLESGGEIDSINRKSIMSLTKVSDQICGDRAKFDEQYRVLVLDPISRFAIIFPDFEDLIRKRNAKLLDYDSARGKVRRQIDKPSSDAAHLPKLQLEEESTRKVYEDLNEGLLASIPELLEISQPYMSASAQALYGLLANRAEAYYRKSLELPSLPESISSADLLNQLASLEIAN